MHAIPVLNGKNKGAQSTFIIAVFPMDPLLYDSSSISASSSLSTSFMVSPLKPLWARNM